MAGDAACREAQELPEHCVAVDDPGKHQGHSSTLKNDVVKIVPLAQSELDRSWIRFTKMPYFFRASRHLKTPDRMHWQSYRFNCGAGCRWGFVMILETAVGRARGYCDWRARQE